MKRVLLSFDEFFSTCLQMWKWSSWKLPLCSLKKSETISAANKMSTRRKRQAPAPPPLALEVVTRTRPLALPPLPPSQGILKLIHMILVPALALLMTCSCFLHKYRVCLVSYCGFEKWARLKFLIIWNVVEYV